MTKGSGFPLGSCRDHITNLHLAIIDNHSINEQFYQLATLGESQVGERRGQAVAEGSDTMREGEDIDLLLRLGLELPQLLAHTVLGLG